MIKTLIITIGLALSVVVPVVATAPAQAANFGDNVGDKADPCVKSFLGFPPWYRGLPKADTKDANGESACAIGDPAGGDVRGFVIIIVLNIIDIALRVVGYAAVGYIIYGGFKYLTSAGSADRIVAGRKIILNAIIGLVISFLSVAIVNLILTNIQA